MSPDDRGFDDRNRFADRGADDRGLDRGLDRGHADRGNADRGLDRGLDRGNADSGRQRFADRGLEEELAQSGRQARQSVGGGRPDPVFAAELRDRLVARLERQPAPLWPFGWAQRAARGVPIAVAGVLLGVAMVGASQLNIGSPEPSNPPAAATDKPDPTDDASATWYPEASDDLRFVVPFVTPTPVPATPAPTSTPAPTPKPSTAPPPPPPPAPTPTPGLPTLSLSLKPCDGGVVIGWSKYTGAGFNHYTTLRNTVNNIPLAYPPQGGAVDFGGTYTTDVTALSAVDATGTPFTTYSYRAMAFDASDTVIAASAVGSAQAKPTLSLGALGVAPDPGGTQFTWAPYGGPGACFTYYKLVASTTNPNPSYLNGDPYLWAGSTQGQGSVVSPDLVSGQTYYLRVQVIRATALGAFVAAQTDVATYTVP